MVPACFNAGVAITFIEPMLSLSRHPGYSDIASVLVQNHRNDLSGRIALEVDLRINNLEKELVLGARKEGEGSLPGDLGFEMIALEPEIDDGAGIELAEVACLCQLARCTNVVSYSRYCGPAARLFCPCFP
jgi:hypothetical protein